MLKKSIAIAVLLAGATATAFATTPSGEWTLKNNSKQSMDYFMRIDVDPGERYPDKNIAPSSVFYAEKITFNNASGGYLGLQRYNGDKLAIASIWDAIDAKGGSLPPVYCEEFGPCKSIKGNYDWKVGHNYRFRVETSPRTQSDTGGDWWQITLVDLTLGTADILGEIKTPKWDGLHRTNRVFLEYFQGPFECNTLRHSKATEAPTKGKYGQDSELASSHGTPYAAEHVCKPEYLLPGMTHNDNHGSTSWDNQGTLTLVGNYYRGIHQWGNFQHLAKKGMMFVKNKNEEQPYIFKALHDGTYGPLPAEGSDNSDWKSIGKGYPIINDLYLRHQKLLNWENRKDSNVKVGDFYIYHNPYNKDTEFFKLAQKGASFFPTDKSSNQYWTYVGRYPKKDESLSPQLPIHQFDNNKKTGKKGWMYYDVTTNLYFILKTDKVYGPLPSCAEDNEWWQFAGYYS